MGLAESALAAFIKPLASRAIEFVFDKKTNHLSEIPKRFFKLFESHGVQASQIPKLLSGKLTLQDLQNKESLLRALNPEILDATANLFGVNIEWLEGASEDIYSTSLYYKRPKDYASFLDSVIDNSSTNNWLDLTFLICKEKTPGYSALLILREPIFEFNDKTIYRHYIDSGWIYKYWKCRAYLASMAAIAVKKRVRVRGFEVSAKTISKFAEGQSLFNYQTGTWNIRTSSTSEWHPEDLALDVDIFLDGVDEGIRGKRLGLEYWLMLEEKGLMKTGLPYSGVREKFEKKLEEINGGPCRT